jgi:hypothetical protein
MIEFPKNANIPPIVGEYCYYHADDTNIRKGLNLHKPIHDDNGYGTSNYICEIDGQKGDMCVHYSLPDNLGSRPWVSCHKGGLHKIVRENKGAYYFRADKNCK